MFHLKKCPKCKSSKIRKIQGVNDKIKYYECLKCKHVWWEFSPELYDDNEVTGDNYPLIPYDNRLQKLAKERKEFMKELLKWGFKPFTKDDIVDLIIDIELFNKQCEKKRKKNKWN